MAASFDSGSAIGTFGTINVRQCGHRRYVARTRFRDLDGRLREVTATAGSGTAAQAELKERLIRRPGYGTGGLLSLSSPCGDLVGAVAGRSGPARHLSGHQGQLPRRPAAACPALLRALHVGGDHHRPRGVVPQSGARCLLLPGQALPGRCSTSSSPSRSATTPCPAIPSRAPPRWRSRRSRFRRSRWSRRRRSAQQPRRGGQGQASRGRSPMARSATPSRSCSAPPCAQGRRSPCGLVTSSTVSAAWWPTCEGRLSTARVRSCMPTGSCS